MSYDGHVQHINLQKTRLPHVTESYKGFSVQSARDIIFQLKDQKRFVHSLQHLEQKTNIALKYTKSCSLCLILEMPSSAALELFPKSRGTCISVLQTLAPKIKWECPLIFFLFFIFNQLSTLEAFFYKGRKSEKSVCNFPFRSLCSHVLHCSF